MAKADAGGLVGPDAVVVGPAVRDRCEDSLDDAGGEAPFSENPGDPAHRSAAFAEVSDGLLEPVAKRDLRLPAKQARAFSISGWRWRGSSAGSGFSTISDLEPVMSMIVSASSRMVNSVGLPRLIGPVTSAGLSISRTRPSIRSST